MEEFQFSSHGGEGVEGQGGEDRQIALGGGPWRRNKATFLSASLHLISFRPGGNC